MTRRRLLRLLAAATVLAAGGVAVWLLLPPSDLERLRVELDATDPGWRFADIHAARQADQPPPAENVVHVMTAAARLIPPESESWLKDERSSPTLTRQSRPVVRPAGVAAWRAATEAIAVARRAADLTRGAADTAVPDDPFQYPWMGYAVDAQRVAFLLQADALFAGRHGDPAGAVASVRAILSIARGLDRNPFMTEFGAAHGLQALAVVALRRALAVAEPSAADLAAVAADLRTAADPAAFVSHLRD